MDDHNRSALEVLETGPFRPYRDKSMSMSYWEIPADLLEDQDRLIAFATDALAAARRAPAKKKRGRS